MNNARGFTLLEILIALVIIAVGLLGIASLQGHASRAEMESYQRAQALILISDMLNRIEANTRDGLECYATEGAPTQAGTGAGGAYSCSTYGSPDVQAIATADLVAWHNQLLGSAENKTTGAMIQAAGCITFAAPETVTVAVFWQGLTPTKDAVPPAGCVTPDYGAGLRRGVSRSVRLPKLIKD